MNVERLKVIRSIIERAPEEAFDMSQIGWVEDLRNISEALDKVFNYAD